MKLKLSYVLPFLFFINYHAGLPFRPDKLKKEGSCNSHQDCLQLNECVKGQCKHKQFFPITSTEIYGSILIFFGSALSNAGGVGGGGLLVPILVLFLNFNPKEAIPISKLMIFSGSLTAFLLGLKNQNPFRDSPAIDFNLSIVIIPLVLFGTMLGVTMNKIFPPWMILILLTVILVYNTYKTLKKGIDIYHNESKGLANLAKHDVQLKDVKYLCHTQQGNISSSNTLAEDTLDDSENTLLKAGNEEKEKEYIAGSNTAIMMDHVNVNSNSITRQTLLEFEFKKDRSLFPFNKIIFCIISYCVLIAITLLKGSPHMGSIANVKLCSPLYWTIYLSYIPISIVILIIVARIVTEEYNYRKEIGYPYHPTDVKWNMKNILLKYPFYALLAGSLSGLLGIGGGTVLGPMLLELNIHPLVSIATSNFLVVLTSSATTLQYSLMGLLNYNYGFFCLAFATCGSYIGTIIIQSYVEKTGRYSILVLILAAVLGASTIFIPGHALIQMIHDLEDGIDVWDFKSPC